MGITFVSLISFGRLGTSPVQRTCRALQAAAAAAIACSMLGCSTTSSISDSVSSPFKWSSDSSSSSSGEQKESYQHDIRTYTAAYVSSNSDVAGLTRGLASIAHQQGITNWEADRSTYLAVGEGLAKAEVPEARVEVYQTTLSRGDAAKADAIRKGFEQER